jgi:hypothetical protein
MSQCQLMIYFTTSDIAHLALFAAL